MQIYTHMQLLFHGYFIYEQLTFISESLIISFVHPNLQRYKYILLFWKRENFNRAQSLHAIWKKEPDTEYLLGSLPTLFFSSYCHFIISFISLYMSQYSFLLNLILILVSEDLGGIGGG